MFSVADPERVIPVGVQEDDSAVFSRRDPRKQLLPGVRPAVFLTGRNHDPDPRIVLEAEFFYVQAFFVVTRGLGQDFVEIASQNPCNCRLANATRPDDQYTSLSESRGGVFP